MELCSEVSNPASLDRYQRKAQVATGFRVLGFQGFGFGVLGFREFRVLLIWKKFKIHMSYSLNSLKGVIQEIT